MNEIIRINRKMKLLLIVVLIGIMIAVCFSLASGDSAASGTKNANIPVSIWDQAIPEVRGKILRAATQGFEPSLEMKENVDFILTPSLLVQEVISDDVVITYPSE
ncbi:MAG: hypothetical protein ACFFCW_31745 [Candidatus Hodarchaeota archaeon]